MVEHILKSNSSVISHYSFYGASHIAKLNTRLDNSPVFINKEGSGCREAPLHNKFIIIIKKQLRKRILFLTASIPIHRSSF